MQWLVHYYTINIWHIIDTIMGLVGAIDFVPSIILNKLVSGTKAFIMIRELTLPLISCGAFREQVVLHSCTG